MYISPSGSSWGPTSREQTLSSWHHLMYPAERESTRSPRISLSRPRVHAHLHIHWWDISRSRPICADLSSDYVFDGTFPPYETDSQTNPLQLYGKSKRDGESAVSSVSGAKTTILRVPVLSVSSTLNSIRNNNMHLDMVPLRKTLIQPWISSLTSSGINQGSNTKWITMRHGIPPMLRT